MNIPENIEYFNSHTHSFCFSENVFSIINIFPEQGIQKNDNKYAENMVFSIGLHPWFIRDEINATQKTDQIKQLSQNAKIVAIGECGLDKIRKSCSFELQMKYFIEQAKIAEKQNKPLLIHAVRAYPEIISIRKNMSIKHTWIIHAFNGNETEAEQLIKKGFYLSLGPSFLAMKKNKETINQIQNEKILLENDDSNYDIREIYEMASKMKNISINNLKRIVRANFAKTFN